LDRVAKSSEALFAAHAVKAHEQLASVDSHRRLASASSTRSFGRAMSWDSNDGGRQESNVRRSHISIIMHRQMIHHSVLMVCCFYGMLAGYEVLSYVNELRDADSIVRMLQRVHLAEGNSGLFNDVLQDGFDRLEARGLKAEYLQVNGEEIFGSDTEIDSLRTSPPVAAQYVLPEEACAGLCEVHFNMSRLARADVGKSLYLSFMSIFVIFGTTAMMHKTLQMVSARVQQVGGRVSMEADGKEETGTVDFVPGAVWVQSVIDNLNAVAGRHQTDGAHDCSDRSGSSHRRTVQLLLPSS
jgi:hypothetical protein